MTSMNQKQKTMVSTRTNWHTLIGVFLILGVGVCTSLWYSGHVAAQDGTISSQEMPRVAFTKVAGHDGDGSELNSIGTLTNTDPTFDRPFSCGSLSGRTTRYDAIPFTVGVAGSVTISFEESDGGSISPNGTGGTGPDTFVVLYAGAFNPASPLTNCSTLNDDISSATNRRSRITTNLAAGPYTAVVTTFAATPSNTADDAALPWSYSLAINTPVTLTVTNTNDTGAGSLRAAMTAAGNGAVIGFSALFNTPQTIGLQTALPTISTSITIRGPGPDLLIVRRNVNAADFRIFNIVGAPTDNVAISGMTISGGRATGDNGGAILSQTNVTLTNLHVTGNQASNGAGAFLIFANVAIANCTFSNNQASSQGGGFQYQGGGGNTFRLLNSSISGNTSGSFGGGIEYLSIGGSSRLEITNSTIANNSAANGGGVDTFAQDAGNATTTIRNTIISGNTPDNLAVGAAGGSVATFQTLGFNLSENYNGVFTPLATDITAQPLLGPLANNGGTPTHALLAGSPALDKGNRSGAPNDQRGLTRPIDLAGIPNAVGGDGSDIGAYEAQTAPVVDNPPTAVANVTNVTTAGGSNYIFTVTYTDDIAINVSTLNLGDVTASGPGGFAVTPTFVSFAPAGNGTPRTATYFFTPPGGSWDATDNGPYTINVVAGQVADTGGNFVPAGPIGSFMVNIAAPQTFVVTNLNNAGAGSLRQAILDANANTQAADTINFLAGLTGTISLLTELAEISDSVTINGPGANVINVRRADGAPDFRIFVIQGGISGGVTISGLTVSNGRDLRTTGNFGFGGGVFSESQTTLTNLHVTQNTAADAGGVYLSSVGGSIIGCTISNNTVTGSSGGLGVFSATVTLTNSTLSANTAGAGGAITNVNGNLTIRNSTLTANTGSQIGGIVSNSQGSVTTVSLKNSIVSGNTGANLGVVGPLASFSTQGFNLSNNFNGVFTPAATDIVGNPLLGPLASNGGPTQTHALLAGSPALDKGDNTGSGQTTDQRGAGFTRTIDLAGITNAGDGTDIGAFEAQTNPGGTPTPTNTPTATPTATPTPGAGCSTSYAGVPVSIPDNIPAGVNISLPVSNVGVVSDLNFGFDTAGACDATVGNTNAAMDHTFIGDLTFRLTPPDGSPTVTFQTRRGGQRDNICTSTLDDEGGFPNISTLTDLNGATQSGNFSPETTGQLSLLDGENANGTWTLNVSDNANIDTGSMRRFSLVFNTGGTCSGTTPTPTNTPTATPTSTPTATPTPSGGFIVTNLNDSGAGSLRQAILDANANANSPAADTINFQAGLTGTIALTGGEIVINDSVTINGPGATAISVSGNNQSRIFHISAGSTVAINGLTLTGGNGVGAVNSNGGAIRSGGDLTLSDSVISGNTAGSGAGGGIATGASFTLIRSLVSGNSASNGGGILSAPGTVSIVNSTISGNTAAFQGGGLNIQNGNATIVNTTVSGNTANSATFPGAILFAAVGEARTLQMINSTIAGNTTGTPNTIGGLYVTGGTATATLRNSILANNGPINLLIGPSGGTITSQGYNLTSDSGGGFLTGTADQINTNPLLGPLANNGGPTQTHGLLTGSPAIDKGDNTGSGVTTDQRGVGFARTVDLPGITNAGDGTDIGAFEAQTAPAGGGFESDVAPRALNGDGVVTSTDVVQMRRFAATLDVINTATNEYQRADTAPRATAGNGFLDSGDVVQARRYAATLDPITAAAGPTAPNPEPPPPSMLDEVYAYFFGREMRIGKAVYDGDAITFAVDMNAIGDEAAVGFTLEYDALSLANPRVSLGDGLASDAVLTVNTNENGRIGVLIDSATALAITKGTARVITVTFDRIGESSNNKIAFTEVLAVKSMANSNGDLLAVRWIVSD